MTRVGSQAYARIDERAWNGPEVLHIRNGTEAISSDSGNKGKNTFSVSRGRWGKIVSALLFAALVTAAAAQWMVSSTRSGMSEYDSAVLADQPVAFWTMGGVGTEPDLTGNGHYGTYLGGHPSSATMPNGDQAVALNGSTQRMAVMSSPAFSIPTTGQLTWEAWIRPDVLQFPISSGGYVDWLGKCQGYSPTCEWGARIYNATNAQNRASRLSAYAFNPGAGLGSGAVWQPDPNVVVAGQWLHIVGEYQIVAQPAGCGGGQVGGINIWVNGVRWDQASHLPTGCMGQYDIAPQAGDSPLNVGSMALDSWFQGAIGKVAIYDTLLSQPQISAHFTAMVGAPPSGACDDTCHASLPDNR